MTATALKITLNNQSAEELCAGAELDEELCAGAELDEEWCAGWCAYVYSELASEYPGAEIEVNDGPSTYSLVVDTGYYAPDEYPEHQQLKEAVGGFISNCWANYC